ncbi:MAG: hypothetical protein OEY87_09620, partial [Gammaproteobacteria bacterium]|nr:hypothetical protein [Gammaproteobacteria bacterium]
MRSCGGGFTQQLFILLVLLKNEWVKYAWHDYRSLEQDILDTHDERFISTSTGHRFTLAYQI